MKTLTAEVANEIKAELESLPEKYANSTFNSHHEGLAVIQEEFEELKNEVFFGEKRVRKESWLDGKDPEYFNEEICAKHNSRMRKEAIQIAAMCVRFIQELT